MNLWQMLMARRGLMDVAESHERGGAGAGAPAGAEEQGTQESGKQNGEQKDQPKIEDDEFGGMTQEELLAELRKSKKAGADLLKENMKRKEKSVPWPISWLSTVISIRHEHASFWKLSKPQKTHAVRRSKLNWNAAVNSML